MTATELPPSSKKTAFSVLNIKRSDQKLFQDFLVLPPEHSFGNCISTPTTITN